MEGYLLGGVFALTELRRIPLLELFVKKMIYSRIPGYCFRNNNEIEWIQEK